MKNKILPVALILSACSTAPRVYDPVEYGIANNLSVSAARAINLCDVNEQQLFKEHIKDINTASLTLQEFTLNKAQSEEFHSVAVNIGGMVTKLLKRGKITPTFCRYKLTDIQIAARTLARASGKLDKFERCASDTTIRYDMFSKAYKDKRIDEGEFKELLADITSLNEADMATCTVDKREEIKAAISKIIKAASLVL